MRKLTANLLILLISFGAYAQTALEWQKVTLEDKIETKIKFAIGKVLSDHEYMVEADIQFNDPGPPNFDDLNKVGLKVSDIPFDDSKGDYIAFSKIGLEVPVLEKYHNEHQMKLKELHKFNEAYNLFKALETATITVYTKDGIDPNKVENAKTIVKNLKFNLGEVKPEIKFESMAILPEAVDPTKVKEDGLSLKDILDFISRFGNAIGMILTTLLLGGVIYWLMKKWFEFLDEQREKDKEEEEEEVAEEGEGEGDGEEAGELIAIDENLWESSSEENFARFMKFYENSRHETTLMLKRWINEYTDDSQNALRALAQQVSQEQLNDLFEGLNDIERGKWKTAMEEFLGPEEIVTSNKFISEEVVREMIGPSAIQDIELIDLLITLPLDVACRFVMDKPKDGKVLMNLLTPAFSGRILDRLSEEDALEVINNSLEFDFTQVKDEFAGFKKILAKFKEDMRKKPFNQKLLEMLPEFNPVKEKMLYTFLAKEGMRDEMIEIGKKNIPSDLIVDLPGGFLKKVLQDYPMNKKVVLLSSLEDVTKDKFLATFAEKGSAAREMIDLEFENLANDQIAQARIKNKKDDIWKEFVDYTRGAAKVDDEFKGDIELITTTWVDNFIAQEGDEDMAAAA
jgi:hypothetical protein